MSKRKEHKDEGVKAEKSRQMTLEMMMKRRQWKQEKMMMEDHAYAY